MRLCLCLCACYLSVDLSAVQKDNGLSYRLKSWYAHMYTQRRPSAFINCEGQGHKVVNYALPAWGLQVDTTA